MNLNGFIRGPLGLSGVRYDRQAFLTVRSTRFAGRGSGLDVGFESVGVWLVVAGTGWGLRGRAPDDFTQ